MQITTKYSLGQTVSFQREHCVRKPPTPCKFCKKTGAIDAQIKGKMYSVACPKCDGNGLLYYDPQTVSETLKGVVIDIEVRVPDKETVDVTYEVNADGILCLLEEKSIDGVVTKKGRRGNA